MKLMYKYLALGVFFCLLLYHSVYVRPLDEVLAEREAAQFDPATYANAAFERLINKAPESAIPVEDLWKELKGSPQSACEKQGKVLGISNKCFFLIQGQGEIIDIDEEGVLIKHQEKDIQLKIATEFIFGNAIREASGEVPVSDFASIMNFNKVAEEMNKKVREEVVSPFLSSVSEGMSLQFVVAASIRKDKPFTPPLNTIPISLSIQ